MSDLIKIRRGTTTQLSLYTPADGEMVWATDTSRMYIGNGSTPGGKPVGREVLTSNRTYYVRTDGSDLNSGLVNTSGGAFLTPQKAISTVLGTLDSSIYDVTIKLSDGTYPGFFINTDMVGSGTLYVDGNSTSTSNVVLTSSGGTTVSISSAQRVVLRHLKLSNSSVWGINVQAIGQSTVTCINVNHQLSSTTNMAHYSAGLSVMYISGTSTITGSSGRAWVYSTSGKFWISSATVSFSGTPAWGDACVLAGGADGGGGVYIEYSTLTGPCTGKRYSAMGCGVINVLGQGINFIPGNVAGSTATGGQYL